MVLFPSTRGAGGAAGGLHLRHGSMRFAELTASYGPAPSVGWAELCEAHRWSRDAPWSRAEARATFRCGTFAVETAPTGDGRCVGWMVLFPSTRGAGGAAGGLHLRHGSMRFAELTAPYGPAPSVGWAELCEAHRWSRDAPWSRAEARATFRCGAFAVETAPTGDGRCVGWMVLFSIHPGGRWRRWWASSSPWIDAVRRAHRILRSRSVRRMG